MKKIEELSLKKLVDRLRLVSCMSVPVPNENDDYDDEISFIQEELHRLKSRLEQSKKDLDYSLECISNLQKDINSRDWCCERGTGA